MQSDLDELVKQIEEGRGINADLRETCIDIASDKELQEQRADEAEDKVYDLEKKISRLEDEIERLEKINKIV